MEYEKFRREVIELALAAGFFFEEDSQTGDLILTGITREVTWTAVRSVDRKRIDSVFSDEEEFKNPAIWLECQRELLRP